MNKQRLSSWQRSLTVFLVSALLLMNLIISGTAQAATLEETLTNAGKDFLSSVAETYAKDTQASYNKQFKSVQQTLKVLSKQLEQAANPTTSATERAKLLEKIGSSQNVLQEAATSFNGLADQTGRFDKELEQSTESLLTTVQNQFKAKFAGDQDAFQTIAQSISAIADDTKAINTTNLPDFLNQVRGHAQSLTQAFDVASKGIKSVQAFAS